MNTKNASNRRLRVDFRPFRAWRYDPGKIELSKVIAPPYDVISPAGQDALYKMSPYNCVRLILNRVREGDREGNDRYTRARDFFLEWSREGVLLQEKRPCFYLYQQEFSDPSDGRLRLRSAFLGSMKLEPFEKGIVMPHEKTLAAPKADRKRLLAATRTNFSPIFGLFEDANQETAEIITPIASSEPLLEAGDPDGVTHALWRIEDTPTTSRLRELFALKKIYIADGHHRYQTALDYSLEERKRQGISDEKELASDFVLMALVAFQDPGHVLLPTHRLITSFGGIDSEEMLLKLKPFFDCEIVFAKELVPRLENIPPEQLALGLVLSEATAVLLVLKDPQQAKSLMPPGKPDVWYTLDVNLLAYLVLSRLWGFSESRWEEILRFTHSTEEAIRSVIEERMAAAFLLRTPRIGILRDMGMVGELMPQKSTYFYPKLASGFLFHQHDSSIHSSETGSSY